MENVIGCERSGLAGFAHTNGREVADLAVLDHERSESGKTVLFANDSQRFGGISRRFAGCSVREHEKRRDYQYERKPRVHWGQTISSRHGGKPCDDALVRRRKGYTVAQ